MDIWPLAGQPLPGQFVLQIVIDDDRATVSETLQKTYRPLIIVLCCLLTTWAWAQPTNDNCGSSRSIPLSNGIGCSAGTTLNADDDLTSGVGNAQCPTPTVGNEVWFEFLVTGAANTITVEPNGNPMLQDAYVAAYSGNCNALVLLGCAEATGTGSAAFSFGANVGETIYISVSSATAVEGYFDICVESQVQNSDPGNSCSVAALICNKELLNYANLDGYSSSGANPSCFNTDPNTGSGTPIPVQRDVWIQFVVTKGGTCEFVAYPKKSQEFDWAMFDITNGCPGTEIACNYNYAGDAGAPTGMSSNPGDFIQPGEFEAPINLIAGRRYALLIDNYSGENGGYHLEWGGNFDIGPINPGFDLSNPVGCNSVTTSFINTTEKADNYFWNLGGGDTFNGPSPPAKTYSEPGNHIVALTVTDNLSGCTGLQTKWITVSEVNYEPSLQTYNLCAGDSVQMNGDLNITSFVTPLSFQKKSESTIPEDGGFLNTSMNIQGVIPANLNAASRIHQVCVDIRHQDVSQLEIILRAPDGRQAILLAQGEANGVNLTNTCFSGSATNSIVLGSEPYTDTYASNQGFEAFLGNNINGQWTLLVKDHQGGISGFLYDWSIAFENYNSSSIKWTPNTYLRQDNVSSPWAVPNVANDHRETVQYTIKATDALGCEDIDNVTLDIFPRAYAGEDTAVTVCAEDGILSLQPLLRGDEEPDGTWLDQNGNTVTDRFDPGNETPDQTHPRYYVVGRSDGCGYDTAQVMVYVEANPQVQLVFNDPVCEGDLVPVNIKVNGGAPPYTVSFYTDSGKIDFDNLSGNDIVDVPVGSDPPVLLSVTSATGCTSTLNQPLNMQIVGTPRLKVDSIVCNDTGTHFVVYMDVSGGDPATTTVNGQPHNNGKVISSPVPSGSTVTFIARDDNDCNQDELEIRHVCNCKTDAGTLATIPVIDLCDNDNVQINHSGGFLDGNDVRMYILHEQNSPTPGTIIDTFLYAAPLNFVYNPAWNVQYNQTYYLTLVAGDENANTGYVDLSNNNGCNSFSESQEIRFFPDPALTATVLTPEVCEGETAEIMLQFTAGIPPFSLIDQSGQTVFSTSKSVDTMRIAVFNDLNIAWDRITSSGGCGITAPFSAFIKMLTTPVAQNIQLNCNDIFTAFNLQFDLQGGDPNSYNFISNVGGTLNGNQFTATDIASGTVYEVKIFDKNACDTLRISGVFSCPCQTNGGTWQTPNSVVEVCVSDTYTAAIRDTDNDQVPDGYSGDANDTLSYILVANTSDTGLRPIPAVQHLKSPAFFFDDVTMVENTTYYAFIIAGDNDGNNLVNLNSNSCLRFSNPISIRFNALPEISTTGTGEICFGQPFGIPLTIAGNAPVQFKVVGSDGFAQTFSRGAGTDTVTVVPLNEGTVVRYWIDTVNAQILDNTQPVGCVGRWLGDTARVKTIQIPQVDITQSNAAICQGESISVPVDVTGEGQVFFEMSDGQDFNVVPGTYPDLVTVSPAQDRSYQVSRVYSVSASALQCAGWGTGSFDLGIIPLPEAELLPDKAELCEGESFELNFTATGQPPFAVYYQYNRASMQALSDGNGNFPPASFTPATDVSLLIDSVRDDSYSDVTQMGCINFMTDSEQVIMHELPVARIVPLNEEICRGDSGNVLVDIGGNAPFDLRLEDIETGDIYTFYQLPAGRYPVKVIPQDTADFIIDEVVDVYGCLAIQKPGQDQLPVNPIPQPDFLSSRKDSCAPFRVKTWNTTDEGLVGNCRWQIDGEWVSSECASVENTWTFPGMHSIGLEVTSSQGCTGFYEETDFVVHPDPEVAFSYTPEIPNQNNSEVFFVNQTPDTRFQTWIIDSLARLSGSRPVFKFPEDPDRSYGVTLVVTSSLGCTDSLTRIILIEGLVRAYIPNAFTPDDDAINETLTPVLSGHSHEGYAFRIFNRWGEEIFFSDEVSRGWDGRFQHKPALPGLYHFILKVKSADRQDEVTFRGNILLIR